MPRRDGLRIWKILKKRFSWVLTMVLRNWDLTMQTDNWVSAIRAGNGDLCHRVEFSTVATAVKFCRSRPAKMNWDLKHHEMCWTLGVILAQYDYERVLRIVSLSSCRWTEADVNKRFVSKQRSRLCIRVRHMYLYMCCITVVIDITKLYNMFTSTIINTWWAPDTFKVLYKGW